MRKLTAGLIGYGFAGRNIHLSSLVQNDVRLIGIADIDEHALAAVPKGIPTFRNYADLLKEKPDLVSICTPEHLHASITMEAIEQGINVLVEKPLAITAQDALTIADASRAHSVQVCVMHHYKYFEPFIKLKAALNAPKFGSVFGARIFFGHGLDPGSLPQEYVHGTTQPPPLPIHVTHPFYLLEWMFGAPKSVMGRRKGDNYHGQFETEKATVHLDISQLNAQHSLLFKIDATGSTYSLIATDPAGFWMIGHRVKSDISLSAKSSLGQATRLLELLAKFAFNHRFQYSMNASGALISDFIQSIRKGEPSPIPLDEAYRALEYAEKYIQACNQHQSIRV